MGYNNLFPVSSSSSPTGEPKPREYKSDGVKLEPGLEAEASGSGEVKSEILEEEMDYDDKDDMEEVS